MIRNRWTTLVMLGALTACGDPGRAEPITEMKARDLRAEQSRERPPGDVLGPMLALTKPDRVIYGAPPDLTLRTADSLLTAPLGITAGPGGATGARTDSTTRPSPGAPPTRDTATRPSPPR